MVLDLPTDRPLRAAAARPAAPDADPAVEALPLRLELQRLLPALRRAAAARRKVDAARRKWGEPSPFFFRGGVQSPAQPSAPDAPAQLPAYARTLASLERLRDELEPRMEESVEVRRAARAVAGLTASVAALATDLPELRPLADLADLCDDEVILVLHPAAGLGWRVRLSAARTINHLAGLLPRRVMLPKVQLHRPQALRPDGTLPTGVEGCGDWLWGESGLRTIPKVDGERVVLLGEYAGHAVAGDLHSAAGAAPRLDVVQTLSVAEVDAWLAAWCGAAPKRAAKLRAA